MTMPVGQQTLMAGSCIRSLFTRLRGSVACFGLEQEFKEEASFPGNLDGHFEELVDEPTLTPDATPA